MFIHMYFLEIQDACLTTLNFSFPYSLVSLHLLLLFLLHYLKLWYWLMLHSIGSGYLLDHFSPIVSTHATRSRERAYCRSLLLNNLLGAMHYVFSMSLPALWNIIPLKICYSATLLLLRYTTSSLFVILILVTAKWAEASSDHILRKIYCTRVQNKNP